MNSEYASLERFSNTLTLNLLLGLLATVWDITLDRHLFIVNHLAGNKTLSHSKITEHARKIRVEKQSVAFKGGKK